MFLTSTRKNHPTKIVTYVVFVKIGLTIKTVITTADKGVISMFALIVLKKISFLLDVQDRAINVRPKMINSNNNSLITNDTTDWTWPVKVKTMYCTTSTVSCELGTLTMRDKYIYQ